MQDLFADAMQQLLDTHCQPAAVRAIEKNGDIDALWNHLEESGFLDALTEDRFGGAGLGLAEVYSIVVSCGRHALPAPLAQTMLVRAVGSASGTCVPPDPITIAPACQIDADGGFHCGQVPFGRVAAWVLASTPSAAWLLPVATAKQVAAGGHGSLDADLHWATLPANAIAIDHPRDWQAVGACLTAALLAGALERVLEMTIAYANDRNQFGKAIGKFQAIQQQLSVMAEHVFAARMAAQIGFAGATASIDTLRAAVAKERTSAVAPAVSGIAHAVHGAMGFTEEYDLQLYTRRLHEWRMAYGAETYWGIRLGKAALATGGARSLDFVREQIMAH